MSSEHPDPYEVLDGDHAFWAESVADVVEQHGSEPFVIKGGVSPSGVPHIGHANEILRGAIVAAVLRDRGHEVRQVFTADDKDRLRGIPRRLADLDGNLVGLGEIDAGALGRNLGKPYTDIPDPFGSADSYGAHFTELLRQEVEKLGVDVEFVSNTELYADGAFEDVTRHILENREQARQVLANYQDKVDEEYVPFFAHCEECGQLTETITAVDLDAGTVSYRCTDSEAGDTVIEGCGHEGVAGLRDGKLPWRFEWPAQWQVLGVDFEPFGKDHAEGSWPSGVDIARNVLGIEPPVGMVYEWFTLEGDALSSSEGNIVTVSEVLAILEPEVFRYFFSKAPLKQRDFSIETIDQLVDEFDEFERRYFEQTGDDYEQALAEQAYPTVVDEVREERIRIPYTFAAVLGMTDDPEQREEIARREGHIPDDAPEWAVEEALGRVELASEWARLTDNAFNYELKRSALPETTFDEATEQALDELADFIEEGHDGEAIQSQIFEIAKAHDLDVGEFFGAGYRLLFDDTEGPKLGPFLAKLDTAFVVSRLRREA